MPDNTFASDEHFEARIAQFSQEIRLQEQVVAVLAEELRDPEFVEAAPAWGGFRYANPGPKHFCLLKAVRSVSALNAILVLVKGGFTQEIAVLLRTVIECTTHLEYVLAGYSSHDLQEPQRAYVEAYFADSDRDYGRTFPKSRAGCGAVRSKPRVRQEKVHKTLGSRLDELVPKEELTEEYGDVSTSKLMSDSYITYSNFVHSRYPEVMDLFGGEPGHFHFRGMRGTPKDYENLEVVSTFIVTVSNALRYMVLEFDLLKKLDGRPGLDEWFHFFAKRAS